MSSGIPRSINELIDRYDDEQAPYKRFTLLDPALLVVIKWCENGPPYDEEYPLNYHVSPVSATRRWNLSQATLDTKFPHDVVETGRFVRARYMLARLYIENNAPPQYIANHGLRWLNTLQRLQKEAAAKDDGITEAEKCLTAAILARHAADLAAISLRGTDSNFAATDITRSPEREAEWLEAGIPQGHGRGMFEMEEEESDYEGSDVDNSDRGDNDDEEGGDSGSGSDSEDSDDDQNGNTGQGSLSIAAPAAVEAVPAYLRLRRCTECIRKKKVCSRLNGNGPCDQCRRSRKTPQPPCVPEDRRSNGIYGRDKSNEKKRKRKDSDL